MLRATISVLHAIFKTLCNFNYLSENIIVTLLVTLNIVCNSDRLDDNVFPYKRHFESSQGL